MVNPLGINGPSIPDKNGGKSIESSLDNSLPENSQENLDARLDHAIEETFPTSDPVSVTITKGPEPDRSDQQAGASPAEEQQRQPRQDSTEHVLDQVREALHDVADQTSGAARDLYMRGEHYARQVREQYPEAERYIREGQRAVTQRVTGNPLLALLMAGVAGYALAWLIHGQRHGRDEHIPDYGRTSRGYAPHRDEQRMR
jgi:phosphatidylserine/phosphatidylglycerophosphate/cardiolipin synthase-like enzyme